MRNVEERKEGGKKEAEEIFQAIRDDNFYMYETTDPDLWNVRAR